MNEDQLYVQGGPGLAGIMTNEPDYGYMGPLEFMRGVAFTGPALQRYTAPEQQMPATSGYVPSGNTVAMELTGSPAPQNDRLKIAQGERFKRNAEALGKLNDMYRNVIGSINPEAAKDYRRLSENTQDLGYPKLTLRDTKLDRGLADYSPSSHNVRYPVYENLFQAGSGYYPRQDLTISTAGGSPEYVRQMFQYGDVEGPLKDLSLAHELGHAYDNRANPLEVRNYVGEYWSTQKPDEKVWQSILGDWAVNKPETRSKALNTQEAFAEYFQPALNQAVSDRYMKTQMPYYEQRFPMTDYSANKEYQKARQAGIKEYGDIQNLAAQKTQDINAALAAGNIQSGPVYTQQEFEEADKKYEQARSQATEQMLKQMDAMVAETSAPGFNKFKPKNELQEGAYETGRREADAKARVDFLNMFLNRPLQ